MNVPYRTMAVYVLYGVCTFFFLFLYDGLECNWKLETGTRDWS